MGNIIEIENLSVSFGERKILSGIDLNIEAGRIAVIVGPSGSGKTTLLRAVNRLNEEYDGCRTSGTIRVSLEGELQDIYAADMNVPSLRQKAAMVFQSPNVLPVAIAENIMLPLRVTAGQSRKEAAVIMEKALKDAELWGEVKDRLQESALKLSGGQQQRLCLARALALHPSVLLLDEPTASLDFKAARSIEALLTRLKEQYTVLFVSHSLGQAARLADRAIVLRDGRITEQIDREGLHDPAHFQKTMEENF